MPASSECWPQSRQSDTRRFTPVTYDDMRHDHDATWDAKWSADTTRWPEDWFEWQLTRIVNDATAMRGRGDAVTPEPYTDTRPWPPTWITDRATKETTR